MTDRITGRTIIVTGAGSGFGALASKRLATRGAKLVCCDIDEASAQDTADAIIGAGGEAVVATADVSSLADMRRVAALAVERFGAIDVLVNNAGIMPLAFLADHEAAAHLISYLFQIPKALLSVFK